MRPFSFLEQVARLIEPHAIATFLVWRQELGQHRLCYIYRADGPRHVDFEAVQAYLEQTG